MQAPLRDDEGARLEALDQYQIVDTPPETEYDDLTDIAAKLLDAPVALITFVTRERQWFKSACGTEVRESPRDQSFCAWAIRDPTDVMVVEDAAQDPRFADNDFVTQAPFVRFYAGAPMVSRAGRPLGTLCILDFKPRTLSESEAGHLKALARQATKLLELRRAVIEVEHERDRLRSANEDLERIRRQLATLLDNVDSTEVSRGYFESEQRKD